MLKLKPAFGQLSLRPEESTVEGSLTLSVIEIWGLDGSNDFFTDAKASQPAGYSDTEMSTSIPFT